MKAPVLFLVLALASAEAFACDSCQCVDSSPLAACDETEFPAIGDFPFVFSDCDGINAETGFYCGLTPCFGTWAFLCEHCGGGDKRFVCVRCGQSGARIQALLCPQCSSIRRYCIKCGRPGVRIPARLCDQCGYGEKKNECVKCGKIYR